MSVWISWTDENDFRGPGNLKSVSGDYEKCPSSAIHCQRVWANTLDSDRLEWQTQAMRLCLLGHSRAESVWALVQGPAVVHETRWGAERMKWKSFRWWMCLFNQGHTRCIIVCSYNRITIPVGRQKMAYEMIQNNLLGSLQTEVQGEEKLAWHVLCCRM